MRPGPTQANGRRETERRRHMRLHFVLDLHQHRVYSSNDAKHGGDPTRGLDVPLNHRVLGAVLALCQSQDPAAVEQVVLDCGRILRVSRERVPAGAGWRTTGRVVLGLRVPGSPREAFTPLVVAQELAIQAHALGVEPCLVGEAVL